MKRWNRILTRTAAAAVALKFAVPVAAQVPNYPVVPASASLATSRPSEFNTSCQLAWLADPATFNLNLALKSGADGLEVTGYVPTEAVKVKAVEIARAVTGQLVKDGMKVHAQMTLDMPKKVNVEELCQEVRDKLAEEFGDKAKLLRVSGAANGRVVVEGTAESTADRVMVSKCLRGVSGCTHVVNKIGAGDTYAMKAQPLPVANGVARVSAQPNAQPAVRPASAVAPPSSPPPPVMPVMPVAAARPTPAPTPTRPAGGKSSVSAMPAPAPAPVVKPAPAVASVTPVKATTQSPPPMLTPAPSAPAPLPPLPAPAMTPMPAMPVAAAPLPKLEAPAAPALMPPAVAEVPATPALATPARLKSAIEQALGTDATDIKMNVLSNQKVAVSLRVKTSGDWERVYPKLKALPESTGYTMVYNVSTGRPAAKPTPEPTPAPLPVVAKEPLPMPKLADTPVVPAAKSVEATKMGVIRPDATSATPPANPDQVRVAIEKACAGESSDVAVKSVGDKRMSVSLKVKSAGDWDKIYRQIKSLPEMNGYTVIFNVSIKS